MVLYIHEGTQRQFYESTVDAGSSPRGLWSAHSHRRKRRAPQEQLHTHFLQSNWPAVSSVIRFLEYRQNRRYRGTSAVFVIQQVRISLFSFYNSTLVYIYSIPKTRVVIYLSSNIRSTN